MTALTEDTFFDGRIRVSQHRDGYRYSIDAVLLAHAALACPARTVLDLGTGCGIIPLILAFRNPRLHITAVEIQPELADLAARNIQANGYGDRITLWHQDLRALKRSAFPRPVDLVVSNPPYRRAASGRVNPHPQRAAARHEIYATLADVAAAAGRVLELSGRFLVIYPAVRLVDLITGMRDNRIEPKRLRMVHSVAEGEGRLVVVEGIRGGRPGMTVMPPLVIYRAGHRYTDAVARMFQADGGAF